MHWRVHNKIDLTGAAGRSESDQISCQKNDDRFISNNSLIDIVNNHQTHRNEFRLYKYELEFSISAVTGTGFDVLLADLTRFADQFLAGAESALIVRERHRRTLEDTLAALRRSLAPAVTGREDLLAEELRTAAQALGRLTGRVDVEDILDVIFRDFCVGK